MNAEENERVEVKEIRGVYADDIKEAFREMRLVAAGTGCSNYFYHASISPREDESLTPEQWEYAVERLEQNLGLEGHARFQVEHEKTGRAAHRHIVWSRIDPDTMTATSDSYNYLVHNKTREELEQAFEHEPTPPPQERGTRIRDWEHFRAQESGIDPKEVKAEVTALWQQSDSGRAFQSALDDAGYVLCKGDRRDFCLVDQAGDVHSLGRRIDGAKAADIRARLSDVDRDSLMTVQQAIAWVKEQDSQTDSGAHTPISPETHSVVTGAEHFAWMNEQALRNQDAPSPVADWQLTHEAEQSTRQVDSPVPESHIPPSAGDGKPTSFWQHLVSGKDDTVQERGKQEEDERELER